MTWVMWRAGAFLAAAMVALWCYGARGTRRALPSRKKVRFGACREPEA